MIDIPDDAEVVLIPKKWLPLLQSISRGPFIPINFPLPIVVSAMVPDDEIWFCKDNITDADIEVIRKDKYNEKLLGKIINIGPADDRLLSEAGDSN